MALPQKIQQQLDQADSLLQQMNAPEQPAQVEQPAAEAAPADAQTTVEAQPAPDPEPTPAPAPAPAQGQSSDDLLQKYRTLQGIHRYLEDQNRQKEQRLSQLEAELQALRERQVQSERPQAVVDPKDAAEFGDDLVGMVQRVATAMLSGPAKNIEARLAAIEQRLDGTAATVSKTAEEVFLERLRAAVPDYESVNTNQGFLNWLAEEDPVYGVPRQNALTAAANALDATRVAKVFLAYKATLAPAAPAAPERKPAASLEKQIAPSTGASAPVREAGKPTYTTAEVQRFYHDLATGKYRGSEQKAAEIEAALNQALAEGRIVDRMPRAQYV